MVQKNLHHFTGIDHLGFSAALTATADILNIGPGGRVLSIFPYGMSSSSVQGRHVTALSLANALPHLQQLPSADGSCCHNPVLAVTDCSRPGSF
ncbi:hypothetical protein BQ8482_20036 [Mesorhizobium delmotii]|uniref:Uncharacterized protein n=1 Tax=Mesorhizobium delmotii TaxID=1631247 RepID=A0A2P9AJU9_9HYPH|nr:hypothetical protein BQ8482_20036 [Mesorhizobium delmotii]